MSPKLDPRRPKHTRSSLTPSPQNLYAPVSPSLEHERSELLQIYQLLLDHFGPRNWWPGETPFEVMIGAILTQNTAWTNVEKAVSALKAAGLLTPEAIAQVSLPRLRRLIRPSGYFNQKALRLKDYVRFFRTQYSGSVEQMGQAETASLRKQLLAVKGIGPETADSILLYALNKPVFVVDAYTRRAFPALVSSRLIATTTRPRPFSWRGSRSPFPSTTTTTPRSSGSEKSIAGTDPAAPPARFSRSAAAA